MKPDKRHVERESREYRNAFSALLIVVAVLFAYQPAWNAGFIWDDDKYVTGNPLLTAPDGLKRIWFSLDSPSQYFPLTYTSFLLERSVWGLNPAGYHVVNILFHAANALLLLVFLKKLKIPGAWFAAALFALHPVHVESVAWITERKNVLTLFFSLLTMLAWVRFDLLEGKERWRWYGASLVLFALALFAKTTACTLPAAMAVIWWWQGRRIGVRQIAQLIPFLLMGLAMGLVTVWWERHHQGVGERLFIPYIERGLLACRAIWFYLGKLLWPVDLMFSYPRWNIDASALSAWFWPAACLGAMGVVVYIRRFVGRSLECALVFFVATLSPLLGFFILATFRYTFVADHYQYVASIGVIVFVAAAVARLLERHAEWRALGRFACMFVLAVLAVLTWGQCLIYKDPETLWRATIRSNPESLLAHGNLANLLYNRRDVAEALPHYEKAFQIRAESAAAYNLANAYAALGRFDDAVQAYRKALELEPKGAGIAFYLANTLVSMGRADEAVQYYGKALELQPGAPAIILALALAHVHTGDLDAASAELDKGLKHSPHEAAVRARFAGALISRGRLREGVEHYERVLKLSPEDPAIISRLAWVLASAGDASIRDGARALGLAENASQLSGNSPEAQRCLAAALGETGRFDEAIAVAIRALNNPSVQASPELASEFRAQLEKFRSREPYRDPNLR